MPGNGTCTGSDFDRSTLKFYLRTGDYLFHTAYLIKINAVEIHQPQVVPFLKSATRVNMKLIAATALMALLCATVSLNNLLFFLSFGIINFVDI